MNKYHLKDYINQPYDSVLMKPRSDCDDCDVPNYYICGQCEYGQGGSGLYEGDEDYFILMVNGDKFYPNSLKESV